MNTVSVSRWSITACRTTYVRPSVLLSFDGLTVPSRPALAGLRPEELELEISFGTDRVVTTCVTDFEKKISSRYMSVSLSPRALLQM